MAPEYPLGVLKIPGISVPAEYQGCLYDVAGVVALSHVGWAVIGAALDHPSEFVSNRPQTVAAERSDSLE